jgi:uridine phosphorylase
VSTGSDATLPILSMRLHDVPERVLVVGDPARAERVSARLDDARVLSRNREYHAFVGRHHGVEIGVVSHGVGSAGAAVCFEELCRAGTRRLIRAGTCGGLPAEVRDGALVIARAAVRDEGVTPRLVPLGFPAVADPDVVMALRAAATGADETVVEGIVLTSDLFYPHPVLGSDLALWQRTGAVAVEMECAPLFVTASLHGAAAGAILTVDGNPLLADDEDMSGYDPHRDIVVNAVDRMITIALDALIAG